ncbi:panthothenate synthetase [Polaromonas sp. P2-4]|nr:panthothenate synthetase [Polaromonas sp. P2-4]
MWEEKLTQIAVAIGVKTVEKIFESFNRQDSGSLSVGLVVLINAQNPSDVPAFAEPFFLNFQANCKFRIVMSPEDLQKAGLDALGKKWA